MFQGVIMPAICPRCHKSNQLGETAQCTCSYNNRSEYMNGLVRQIELIEAEKIELELKLHEICKLANEIDLRWSACKRIKEICNEHLSNL